METSNRPFLPPYLVEERLEQQQPRRVVTVTQPADPSSPLEVPPQTLATSLYLQLCMLLLDIWNHCHCAVLTIKNASLNGEIANLETND